MIDFKGFPRPYAATVMIMALLTFSPPSRAANADFQNFFFDVCLTPTGDLATRCGETTGGLGNLSGDSESSLNPSQNLTHTVGPVGVAVARSKETRERGEKLRDEDLEAAEEAVKVDLGPFSLLINLQVTNFERKFNSEQVAAGGRPLDGDSRALELGFDYRLTDRAVIGALAGIERVTSEFTSEAPGRNFTPASRAGDTDADNLFLTLFGSWVLGESGYAELGAGFESQDATYRRNSIFQESNRVVPQTNVRVRGSTSGQTSWLTANVGYDFTRAATTFGPFAGLTWTKSDIDGYAEKDLSGSGLAMRFAGTDKTSMLGHAGLRLSHVFSSAAGVLVPQLRVEYQHEFDDDPTTAEASFLLDASQTVYRLEGGSVDRNSINAGLSLALIMANGWMAFFDASALFGNDDFDRTRLTLGVRKEL